VIHLIDDGLTERQRLVLLRLSQGVPQTAIARELGVCAGTIKACKFSIVRHLGQRLYRQRVFRNG
jgi:DNA-binding NarL/FixJ family response regulator